MFTAIVVTYNRSKLLKRCLNSLLCQNANLLDSIIVVNNASIDDTEVVVKSIQTDSIIPIELISLKENLGGAGGFRLGLEKAVDTTQSDWFILLDDDVIFDKNCINEINRHVDKYSCMIAVRETSEGKLAEYAALTYNLKNPFLINPKRQSIASKFHTRNNMPEIVEIDAGSFEGFFIERKMINKIGFPRAEFFIYSDDFEYSLRLRSQGIKIAAIKKARCIRMLDYCSNKYKGWKSYYIWRNFFVLHLLYGENALVRSKPILFMLILYFLKPFVQPEFSPFKVLKDAYHISHKIRNSI